MPTNFDIYMARGILAQLKAIAADVSDIRQTLALAPENADLVKVGEKLYRREGS